MKTCRKCEVEQPLAGFYSDRRQRDGLKTWCKKCWNSYQRDRWADGRTDRAKRSRTNAAWRRANPDRAAVIYRRNNLKRKYGISLERYDEMLSAQGRKCAVCRSTESGDSRFDTFQVDHDHVTGTVRGLLCSSCNLALGMVKDDPDRLLALAEYLIQHVDVLAAIGASPPPTPSLCELETPHR